MKGTAIRSVARLDITACFVALMLVSCRPATPPVQPTSGALPHVLAVETFLADMAQNVAGTRLTVSALLPLGVDPHSFEPTPSDVMKIASSDVLIINGAGLETFLEKLLQTAGGERRVIVASAGLTSREVHHEEEAEAEETGHMESHSHEGDPHFWLDPQLAIRYVENIRDGLSQADPAGAPIYATNAETYIRQLKELDQWIVAQVSQVPEERRLLVTNHESLGYFADRYGFTIIGTVVPSVSSGSSPSARQLAELIDQIRATGAPAVFLETGSNPQLAQQVAREAGVKVVMELYTHSLTEAGGPAPTYIDMMKHNTMIIVEALKQ